MEPSEVIGSLPMKQMKKLGRGLEDFSHLFLSKPEKNEHLTDANHNVVCKGEGAKPARAICITSDKGTGERAFFAVNLALEIVKQGKKVLVFDADFNLPRLCMLMGFSAHNSILQLITKNGEEKSIVEGIDGVKLITLDVDISDIQSLSESERTSLVKCLKNAEEEAEIILIVTSPGFINQMKALLKAVSEIIVVTPQQVAEMINAYGVIKTIFQFDEDAHVGIVSSRIDASDQAEAVFGKMQRIVKKFLDKPLYNYGYIPEDEEVSLSLKRRRPLALTSPSSETMKCIIKIAQSILEMNRNGGEGYSIGETHFSFTERLFDKVC